MDRATSIGSPGRRAMGKSPLTRSRAARSSIALPDFFLDGRRGEASVSRHFQGDADGALGFAPPRRFGIGFAPGDEAREQVEHFLGAGNRRGRRYRLGWLGWLGWNRLFRCRLPGSGRRRGWSCLRRSCRDFRHVGRQHGCRRRGNRLGDGNRRRRRRLRRCLSLVLSRDGWRRRRRFDGRRRLDRRGGRGLAMGSCVAGCNGVAGGRGAAGSMGGRGDSWKGSFPDSRRKCPGMSLSHVVDGFRAGGGHSRA